MSGRSVTGCGQVSATFLRGPILTERWRLQVWGPLPGKPGECGEFVMIVSTYGDRPGWWITLPQL